MKNKLALTLYAILTLLLAGSSRAAPRAEVAGLALGTAFTYQGRLADGGVSANAIYDSRFTLYNDAIGGAQVGSLVTVGDLPVSDGYFTVQLDFGAGAFGSEKRWLEVAVRPGASTGAYTVLSPRQELTPAPFALYASSAGSVPWSGLTGVPAGFADGVDNDTQYSAGTGLGLSGGQFSLNAAYRLPQGCSNNQVPKWNGSAWICAADNNTTSFWSLTGNAGTNPSTNYLGTSDPVALTFKVGGVTALRLLPDSTSPNIVGGSENNQVVSGTIGAVIAGGGAPTAINKAQGNYSVVGGGVGNSTNGSEATVAGGVQNTASSAYTSIGGGWKNIASGSESTVAGGAYNSATDSVASVGGGANNTASGYISTIGGGNNNTADGYYSTIAGGVENKSTGVYSIVAGGYKNNTTGDYAAIAGGSGNTASGSYAVIGGGGGISFGSVPNQATGDWSTVGGGRSNTASGPAATVGGGDGNTASAVTDTVPGGSENTASGGYSFAAGAQASATQIGSFVWSSSESTASWGDFTFTARAPGGTRFYSASGTSTGVQLSSGGTSWGSISDRDAKDNFRVVDNQWLLDQLAAMPIQTWNLKSQATEMRHIGPVAQDFNGLLSPLFGTVEDPIRINNMDAVGVSLAAIQGLYQLNQQQAAEIQSLQARLFQMKKADNPQTTGSLALVWVIVGLLGISQVGMFLALRRRIGGKS